MEKKNIYSEKAHADVSTTISNPAEAIIFIDCDRDITLMDQIKSIRILMDAIPDDTPIVIYIVQGFRTKDTIFPWGLLWEYLIDTGRIFNVVFRGFMPTNSESVFKYSDNITVFLSKGLRYCDDIPITGLSLIEYFRKINYKFEIA